jgi:hypothetical protein
MCRGSGYYATIHTVDAGAGERKHCDTRRFSTARVVEPPESGIFSKVDSAGPSSGVRTYHEVGILFHRTMRGGLVCLRQGWVVDSASFHNGLRILLADQSIRNDRLADDRRRS